MKTNKKPVLLLVVAMALAAALFFITAGGSASKDPVIAAHDNDHGDAADDHGASTEISDDAARQAGIEIAIAGPADIRETVRLSGRVVLNQNRSAAVKARFPGIVRGVFKQVGDTVKRGEKLATVESNESLQVYAVVAPLDGVVLERNVSVGDTASDAPIFTVADLSSLWVEFFVFAADMPTIQQGQAIQIRTLDGVQQSESRLDTIQPMAEASSQTVIARATLDNRAGGWRAGMTVQGDAVIRAQPVALAVPTHALQRMDGRDVVFVRTGTRYRAVPVVPGMQDAESTEITDGLSAGMEVVSRNSFVVKADIAKAAAGHEH